MRDPGPLLAAGRDAEIFEYGPRAVLRRARNGRSLADEAATMAHVRAHGYPVPEVLELSDDGTELVMERVDGPSLLGAASRRPWAIGRWGRTLAELHAQLHDIAPAAHATPGPLGGGPATLHLDLHPLNVIVGPNGPMVIDWARSARGEADHDVAITWAIVGGATVPAGRLRARALGALRHRFLGGFLASFDREAVAAHLAAAVEWKCADPNMTDPERAAMRALVDREPGVS